MNTADNITKNIVNMVGKVVGDFVFSHKFKNTNFYMAKIAVKRNSGAEDIIPIMVYESVVLYGMKDSFVKIKGEYRSFNEQAGDGKNHVKLYVFVSDISYYQNPRYMNDIELIGYVCKEPVIRRTPKGILIADLWIATHRGTVYKSDYIPCIAWDNNALYLDTFELGDIIKIRGRIQSREYNKVCEDGHEEKRIAYEVSINQIG